MNVNPEISDEFGDLADELKQAIPPLPDAALQRVQGQMRQEVARADRRRRWRAGVMGGLLAASVAIAVIGYALTFTPQRRGIHVIIDPPGTGEVVERIRFAVRSASIAPVVERPLVRLEENRALFAD